MWPIVNVSPTYHRQEQRSWKWCKQELYDKLHQQGQDNCASTTPEFESKQINQAGVKGGSKRKDLTGLGYIVTERPRSHKSQFVSWRRWPEIVHLPQTIPSASLPSAILVPSIPMNKLISALSLFVLYSKWVLLTSPWLTLIGSL